MPWKECSVMDERLQFVARRVDGPKPTALPLCESTSLPGGKLHPEREARARELGCPQDSRAPPAQILRNSDPGQEHHPCGARSPWLVERRGRLRRRAQGTALSLGQRPNELWCTDYK